MLNTVSREKDPQMSLQFFCQLSLLEDSQCWDFEVLMLGVGKGGDQKVSSEPGTQQWWGGDSPVVGSPVGSRVTRPSPRRGPREKGTVRCTQRRQSPLAPSDGSASDTWHLRLGNSQRSVSQNLVVPLSLQSLYTYKSSREKGTRSTLLGPQRGTGPEQPRSPRPTKACSLLFSSRLGVLGSPLGVRPSRCRNFHRPY